MTCVLIVEDDDYKLESLCECVSQFCQVEIVVRKSFTSAAKLLKHQVFDLIVLDMSLPTFDGEEFSDEGEAQGLGGKRLVRLCREYDTVCKTILVTQFSNYEELGKTATVSDLARELGEILGSDFIGVVKYNRASVEWRASLERLLSLALSN